MLRRDRALAIIGLSVHTIVTTYVSTMLELLVKVFGLRRCLALLPSQAVWPGSAQLLTVTVDLMRRALHFLAVSVLVPPIAPVF